MAYCRKCGNWMPDNANQCNVCGTRADAPQPQYQPPQYQQPQYQPPAQQGYPTTWSFPKGAPQQGQPQPQQPQHPPQPPKKKKKGLLITLYILLGILVAALLGIGGYLLWDQLHVEDPNLGRYEAVLCLEEDEQIETDGEWIELKKRGKATLHLADQTFSAKWELDGEELTLIQNGDEYYGTLDDGILTLDLEGKHYTFTKDGKDLPEEETTVPEDSEKTPADPEEEPTDPEAPTDPEGTPADPSEAPEGPDEETPQPQESAPTNPDIPNISWWEGDWYGWWIVYEGTGTMASQEDIAKDTCARISVDVASATGTLTMWDLNMTRWEVDLTFQQGSDDRGILCSGTGTGLGAPIAEGDWTVDPTEQPYSNFEDFLCIQGTYQDPYNTANSCTYMVFLRPWGTRWEDIASGDMSDMPYTDMMPILYDDWYLPLIDAGASMPDRIKPN